MSASDRDVASFVSQRVGVEFTPPYTAAGIERDGEVIGGVVFNIFEGADIHVTIAGRGWTRGFMAEVGHYVFSELRCERMTAITEQASVVRIAQRLGGEIEGLMRNHFGPGRDAYVVGILKYDYRF